MTLPRLTPSRVFDPVFLCAGCKRPIQTGELPLPGECGCETFAGVEERDERQLLPGSDQVPDIRCWREDGTAHASIPQRYAYHSPSGFEWSYGGSGPADLALNILGLFVAPHEAWRLHQHYKWEVIGRLPWAGGTIRASEVRDWLDRKWAVERVTAG